MAIVTKSVKDNVGAPVAMAWFDPGGGNPLVPVHMVVNSDGTTVVSPASAAKQDTLAGLVATSAKQDDLITIVGAVTASPTANTLLDRLKTIATNVAALATTIVLAAGSAVIGKVDHTTTGIGSGVTTVTTAGTDVVLAGSTPAKWVEIQAQTDNTGLIAIGASGVDATVATGTGVLLAAGESRTYPVDNLADIFIDSTVNGDGVRYTYGT